MIVKYQIEKIDYNLIRKAKNLSKADQNLLLGYFNKFIAVKLYRGEIILLINTVGKRDECNLKLTEIILKEKSDDE